VGKGETDGLGAHPGLRRGDGGPGTAGAERISGRRNRILRAQLKGRLQLSDAERATLGEIGHRLGRQVLAEVANVARPGTILAWYRGLVARKFDGSQARQRPGRPRISREVEQLIVRMAMENRDWGYDRIAGAMVPLVHLGRPT
jgi:putative transposase